MHKSIDLKDRKNEDESGISEVGLSQLLGPKDMQNPQGESIGDEESKEDMVEMAEMDGFELERLTQGGVAAVNKQIQEHRAQAEREQ